jgi:UDP-N-acetylmuramyl tripeptide synthase
MKLVSTAVFYGPSVFAPFPVYFLKLDLAGLEDWPSGRLGSAFVSELLTLLPGLEEHASGDGRRGGFGKRILEAEDGAGVPFGLLLGHVASELERRHSALGKVRGALLRGSGRRQEIFFGYEDAETAALAARAAPRLLLALLPAEARSTNAEPGDAARVLQAFDQAAGRLTLDPATKLLLRAADARNIPWRRVQPQGGAVALGQGRHRQRLDGPPAEILRDGRPDPELARRYVDRLFPGGGNGRVPIAAITGTNGKTTTSRMLARILETSGRTVGLVTTDGAYVGRDLVLEGDVAGRSGARAVLRDPRVEAAVLETARGGMLKGGAAFDFCDVAAVTNVTGDHLGIDGVDTVEQMARVKQTLLRVAGKRAVVNADDPLCLRIAERSRARELCLVTMDQDNEAVAEHLRNGGPAVVLGPEDKGGPIVLIEGGEATPLMAPKEIPATLEGCARHNVQNAMFAAALARGLGISQETIRRGLAGFVNSIEMSPGRLNIYEGHPFTAAIDYGHNPEGIEVASRALQARYPDRRRICVLTVVGSRHADHIPHTAKAVAGLYDAFVCGRDDTYSFKPETLRDRGFPAEEIPQRIADALAEEGIAKDRLTVAPSYLQAVDAGLAQAEKGDLVAIFTDEPRRTWEIVTNYRPKA